MYGKHTIMSRAVLTLTKIKWDKKREDSEPPSPRSSGGWRQNEKIKYKYPFFLLGRKGDMEDRAKKPRKPTPMKTGSYKKRFSCLQKKQESADFYTCCGPLLVTWLHKPLLQIILNRESSRPIWSLCGGDERMHCLSIHISGLCMWEATVSLPSCN